MIFRNLLRNKCVRDFNPSYNQASTPLEVSFNMLLKTAVTIANQAKHRILDDSYVRKQTKLSDLDIRITVFALWLTIISIESEDYLDEFLYYFQTHGSSNQAFVVKVFELMPEYFKEFTDSYNRNIVAKKDVISHSNYVSSLVCFSDWDLLKNTGSVFGAEFGLFMAECQNLVFTTYDEIEKAQGLKL